MAKMGWMKRVSVSRQRSRLRRVDLAGVAKESTAHIKSYRRDCFVAALLAMTMLTQAAGGIAVIPMRVPQVHKHPPRFISYSVCDEDLSEQRDDCDDGPRRRII